VETTTFSTLQEIKKLWTWVLKWQPEIQDQKAKIEKLEKDVKDLKDKVK